MDARLVASRLPAIPMYGQPFNAPHFPGYLPYGPTDASAFYSPLQAGENADAWRAGLTQAAAAAYYDPALAAHYGYGYGPMGLSDGARRKNATRETTSTLKAWLNEHRKNPYPTKGEKIMLAIITKMTLTQVSTWFANARRRLKKENKMTWSPRNRCGDEDDDDIMDGDDDNNLNNNSNSQMREGHSSSGERNGSRCSSPSPSNIGSTTSDAPHRISSFDLPRQGALHPFMQRPDITGTFSIQGPASSIGANHLINGNVRLRNQVEDDEEIDPESVEDEKKGTAFARRSHSTERHSSDDSLQRRPPVPSPSRGQHLPRSYPAPSHPAFQSSQPNASAAAALARHRLQPHVLASMNADIRNLPSISQSSSIGPLASKISRRDSASPRSHPYSRTAATSPTSSVASSSSVTSPSKPKIWSLADVATSNESNKNNNSESISQTTSSANHSLTTSPTPGMTMFPGRAHGVHGHHRSHLNPEAQATIRNWMDGMMQQKMAAAAAAAAAMSGGQGHPPAFFPNALLPQHIAAALNPAALAVAASLPRGATEGGRFPHPFPGFAELAAQRAQMAAQVAELQSHPSTAVHTTSPSINTNSLLHKVVPLQRNRIFSNNDEKSHSPVSAVVSPHHPDSQSGDISSFSALNTRPDSSDSGIASAETSKENLTQGNESTSAK